MEGGREGTNHDTASLPLLPYFLSSMGKCHNGRISLSDKPSSLKVNRSPRRRWKMNLTYLRFSHTRHTILSAPEPASALRIACIGPSLDPPPHLPTHSLGHSHSPITADYKRVTVVRPSSVRPLVGLRRPSLVRNVTRGGCTVFLSLLPIASRFARLNILFMAVANAPRDVKWVHVRPSVRASLHLCISARTELSEAQTPHFVHLFIGADTDASCLLRQPQCSHCGGDE